MLPSINALIGTYRGSIPKDHYLNDSTSIVIFFYDKVYIHGRIEESCFDDAGVDADSDSNGDRVNRDFGISKENCQRAKVLSSKAQRLERLELVKQMKELEIEKQVNLFRYEQKKYILNKECEDRLVGAHLQLLSSTSPIIGPTNSASSLKFTDIIPVITKEHFGTDIRKGNANCRPTRPQLSAFAQVRHQVTKFKGRYPQYKSMPKLREEVVDICMKMCNSPTLPLLFEDPTIGTESNSSST